MSTGVWTEEGATVSRHAAAPRWRRLSAIALPALVITGGASAFLAGLTRTTITYLPDEWLYSDLARSFALTGRPSLRGYGVAFPALLQPLLTAPAWWFGDIETAFRLTQAINAVAFAAAAIPVFLICGTLGLGRRTALAAASLTIVQPFLVLAGWVTADALGYALALGFVAAALAVVRNPTPKAQMLALTLAALATFARVQYVVLIPSYLLALAVVRRASAEPRRKTYATTLVALGVGLTGLVVIGGVGSLGVYQSFLSSSIGVDEVRHAVVNNLLGFALSPAVYLLPAAIVGLVLGLVRPTGRTEQAFAALTVGLAAALLLESTIVSAEVEIDPYMERYVIILFPLLVPAAALAVRHQSSRRRLFGGLVAASLMIVAFRAPVSLITASGMQSHSSYLRAVLEVENTVGVANAALVVSIMAIAGAAAGALVLTRPQLVPALLTICLVTNAGALALSMKQDRAGAAYAADTTLPADRSWVDHTAPSQVTYLETPGTTRLLGIEQMFWNRSIRRVARMDGTDTLDHAPAVPTSIGRDGTILAGSRPVTGSLLVSRIGSTVHLGNVATLAATPSLILGRADGPARMTLLADRTSDGWLVRRGLVRVWQPSIVVKGTVVLQVANPRAQAAIRIGLSAPSYHRTVRVLPGETVTVRVPVCSVGPFRLAYRADRSTFVDGRLLSLRAPTEPRFVPSGGRRPACGTT